MSPVAAVLLGALLAAWAWTSTTNTQEVLVARHTIERGAVIGADDLARVRLSADPALKPVAASQFDQVVGQRAAYDVAAGAMLTPDSITTAVEPSGNNSIVGVALTPAQAPGLELVTGDRVRVVVTPPQGAELPAGSPTFSDATVASVHVSEETGQTIVDLLSSRDAGVIATNLGIKNRDVLHGWLKALNVLRNHCAHNARIWNRATVYPPRVPAASQTDARLHHLATVDNNRLYFLGAITAHILICLDSATNWPRQLATVMGKFPGSHGMTPTNMMGFPEGWKDLDLWQHVPPPAGGRAAR